MSQPITERASDSAIDQNLPSESALYEIGQQALEAAKALGATAASVSLGSSCGLTTQLRNSELESVEFQRDNDLGITVYFGQKRGHANTGDLKPDSIKEIVAAACTIARHTQEDEAAGLPDKTALASELGDPQLDHPSALSVEQSRVWALQCEQAAFAMDSRIANSEGASVNAHRSRDVLMNSDGFRGSRTTSDYSLAVAVIAKSESDMQRDYWYVRDMQACVLNNPEEVGRIAAQRAVTRLDPRKLKTQNAAVVFPAQLARGLIGHLIGAASGGAIYRRSSFLLDKLGTQLLPSNVNIIQRPHIAGRFGAAWFDAEGVATREQALIENGHLKTWLLGSYSARKLGLQTTGNAGGIKSLEVEPTCALDQDQLMRELGSGLLVTELMGQGVNSSTGDYSRGAAGIWYENGEPAYPVAGITIAGNLLDMYQNLQAIGNDIETASTVRCGSIALASMTIAGS